MSSMVLSAERRDRESGERLKEAAPYLGAVDPLHRPNMCTVVRIVGHDRVIFSPVSRAALCQTGRSWRCQHLPSRPGASLRLPRVMTAQIARS